ncbi:uncharacterized protein LOC107022184 [Solanum pennellii]|uniref:Uncharacterized protein LOC107022184 n=1 Tax=Solanum pennellii TaxID=28526 RepID=A0ABM1VDA3_SOLPN|nr:uncharacterized protein LOC107022184 [Solanum pennellii]
MDVIGPIEPKASSGHRFILVAIDYFTKWVEAVTFIYLMQEVCYQFKIEHRNSTPYRPKAKGDVEAANKNIKKILYKMVQSSLQWHENFPFALLGYRTTVRTSVGATPYSLVYGTKAVIPAEIEIPSLRIVLEAEIDDDEWIKTRLEQLSLIDDKHLTSLLRSFSSPGSLLPTHGFNNNSKGCSRVPSWAAIQKNNHPSWYCSVGMGMDSEIPFRSMDD